MLRHDVRHALRWLRSNPGFTAAALLVLGLGIGASTATFTVIHSVLVRPLPFHEPDRVIRIWSSAAGRNLPFFSVSAPDAIDWRARTTTLALIAPYERQVPLAATGLGEPEEIMGAKVSRELFDLLGVGPRLGRWFSPEEDRPGSGARVAVIAHGLWQRRFGGRPDVAGHLLTLDGEPWTIIGVMPDGFAIPNNPAEIWLPLQLEVDPTARDARYLRVLARLRDGATVEQATSDLTRVAASLSAEYPASNRLWTVTVRPLTETVVSPDFRRALLVAGGGVGLVLLMSCASVASLLLSRATTRVREMAVRTALGASRLTLLRQLLTESLIVAASGGLLGVLLAMWGLDAIAALAASNVPRAAEIALRPAVIVFACAVTTATALIFGLTPALASSRGRLESLRTRDGGATRNMSRTRDLLVVGEVAVAVILLVGAGLMLRSFARLHQRDLGFTSSNLLLVDVSLPRGAAPASFYESLTARLGALPGVRAAAAGNSLPFAGPNGGTTVAIEGRTFPPGEAPDVSLRTASTAYFTALGIPVVRGRTFTGGDTATTPAVIVNQAAARRLFPDADPLGRRIKVGNEPWTPIVGIVGDARYMELEDPRDEVRPMVYFPPAMAPPLGHTIALRTTVPPQTVIASVRGVVAAVAPGQPISRIATMDEILGSVRAPQRFNTTLIAAFAWMALLLAAAGLWGLISHSVAHRLHEIGIRVALGARQGDVLRMTAGRGIALALAGTLTGLLGAVALSGVLERVLFGVTPTDPLTFGGIAVAALLVAGGASLLPARRALQIRPAEALRLE